MNNDLSISMKIISSDNISMKLEDNKQIDANISGGIVEIDPIFTNSPAYKITNADITYWNNKSNFSGNYNDLTNKPVIPILVSQLTNDVGYITKNVNNLANYTLSTNISEVGLTGNYNDLLNTPVIPTKTSDLTNDSEFITNTVNNLTNYTLSSSLASVATSGSYSDLTNTPSLATVATTGFYSDLINKPTIPSLTSQLTNDSGFITNANIPTKTSDLTNDSGFITLSDIPTIPTKTSELTNDSGFITNANIPTKTSDLTNDSGFITNSVNDLTNYTLSSSLASVATSGSYNDLTNKPTIPTKTSDLTNDSGFITNEYSTSSETIIGKWIDGKTIYRKVFNISSPQESNTNYVDVSSLNISTLIHLYGYYKTGTGTFGIPFNDSTSNNSVMFVSNNNYIRGRFGGANNVTEAKVVLEYTKSS